MSLVNDMLRDLDQRRRDADGATSPVKLTPASDFPASRKNRILFVVVSVLLALASGLGFVWYQLDSGETSQQLDIRPAVVSAGVDPESGVTVATEAQQIPVQDREAVTDDSPGDAQAPDSNVVANTVVADQEETPGTAPVALEEKPAAPNARDIAESISPSPLPVERDSDAGRQLASNQVASNGEVELDRVDLTVPINSNTAPMKDAAAMSSEMRDTLAVQAALRMIADNRVTDAYAHLEQHILDNRYAYQSRETFAKLLLNEGELLAAYNLAESGLQQAPNHAGFKKIKARVLIADGQINDAVELLSSRAPAVAEDLEYHEILATAQLASRDYEGALISYSNLVQQNRSQGKWWYGFAFSQDSLGNDQVARQAYNRAIQQPNLSTNLRRHSQDRLAVLSE